MNIIIPMAGLGARFTKYGFSTNKYLLPVNIHKTKMIEKAILTLNVPKGSQFIFILREETGKDTELRNYLKELCDENSYICIILSVNYLTEGPASTAYLAKDYINNEIPLIISNSDQILDWSYDNFIDTSSKYDGAVLTYIPNYELVIGATDKHSFVRFDEMTKKPVEFVEKTVISNEALVGVHYYKKGKYFIKSAEYLFENNIRAPNGEFYLSYTYQALLNLGYEIGTYCLTEPERFYPVGEPEDYFTYYNYNTSFFTSRIDDSLQETQSNLSNYLSVTPLKIYNGTPLANQSVRIEIQGQQFLPSDINEWNSVKCNKVSNLHRCIQNTTTTGSLSININHCKKGETITLNDSLFVLFDPEIQCYTTGSSMSHSFIEDSYYLQVENIQDHSTTMINRNDYVRGWLIGDFEPNIKKTKDYEIGILQHKKDEKWAFHYHYKTTEINILLSGEMLINNISVLKNTLFIFEKDMISCPLFLTDCIVLCIKIPSLPNDKIII